MEATVFEVLPRCSFAGLWVTGLSHPGSEAVMQTLLGLKYKYHVYLFFLIMIFIQFHYVAAGSGKPSHMCTDICLKNIKQCLCFLLIDCGYFLSLYYFPSRILLYCQHITVSSLSKLFDIHFITGVGVREQARSFWVHDERKLLDLLRNPKQSIKFLI